jgi:polysaccharide export outer membrane protein
MRTYTPHVAHRLVTALAIAASAAFGGRCLAWQEPARALEGCTAGYMIGPEDVLDVAVWKNTEISRTVPVRPDGKISLPLLNDVQAAGLTPMQLREVLTKGLVPYIPDPAVSVLVHEVHSFKVTVIGQVKTPGRYELKDRATVLDVLALAGGPNEYAERDRIVVLRQDRSTAAAVQIPFAYDRLTSKAGSVTSKTGKTGSKAESPGNFCVKPGDVILVP